MTPPYIKLNQVSLVRHKRLIEVFEHMPVMSHLLRKALYEYSDFIWKYVGTVVHNTSISFHKKLDLLLF